MLVSSGLWHTNISRDPHRLISELKTAQVSVWTHTHERLLICNGQKEQPECVLCLSEMLNSVCVPHHDEPTHSFTHRIFREEHRDPINSLQVHDAHLSLITQHITGKNLSRTSEYWIKLWYYFHILVTHGSNYFAAS